MDSSSLEECGQQSDHHPLLMERIESHSDEDHIIDVSRHDDDDTLSSSFRDEQASGANLTHSEGRPSNTQAPANSVSFSNRLLGRNSSFVRSDGYGRRRRSPLNSGIWISVELVVTVSQIIASIVVLSLSRNEKPQAPLFTWIVGYASGCVATVPILYWRFLNRNARIEQDSTHSHQGSSRANPSETTPFSVTQASDEESNRMIDSATTDTLIAGTLSTRLNGLVDHFKMALDCFFAVWFVVGNVWVFGGHSSPSDAPKLYRLCVVFLTFSCIGYAMPFILCATICCCLPCIISILGFQDDFSPTRGATREIINALPTLKFKSKKTGNTNDQENASGEGGVLAAGTAEERMISGEDAVCCICLTKFADNDELRELPCTHVFHVDCVDKWLKINASCPLCKTEVGESSSASPLATDSH